MGQKTGKEIEISCLNENLKCLSGTVKNNKSPDSVYIIISTWVKPKKINNDYNKVIFSFKRNIRKIIRENNLINKEIWNDFYILDLDIRSSGIKLDKKSFMSLEFNLYQKGSENNYLPLVSKDNKKDLSFFIDKFVNDLTISDLFINNEWFEFCLTKKDLK